jgi:hypothetical protein
LSLAICHWLFVIGQRSEQQSDKPSERQSGKATEQTESMNSEKPLEQEVAEVRERVKERGRTVRGRTDN